MINLNTKTKVDPKDVVWVEGHINYSKIHFINQKPIFLAITLKKIVEKFDSDDFCRINKGKVVNLAHLDIFKTTSDGLIFQNEYLAISRRMKSGFLNQVKTLSK